MGVVHNKAAIKRLRDGTAAAVSDLQDQIDNIDPGGGLSVTVTDITAQFPSGDILPTVIACDSAYLETYGSIVHFVIILHSTTGTGVLDDFYYNIPDTLKPYNNRFYLISNSVVNAFGSVIGIEDNSGNSSIFIDYEFDNSTEPIYFDLYWIANPAPAPEPEPEPEPTPGE